MESATVLIVDDEQNMVELFSEWIRDKYTVKQAFSGTEAIDQLDDSVDVVLLDRNMPTVSGDDVLNHIVERGIDTRVAMITAIQPDYDIFELGFDAYLQKPVQKSTVIDTIEMLLQRSEYSDQVQELFTLLSRKNTIEATKSKDELEVNQEYLDVLNRIESLKDDAAETRDGFSQDDLEGLFHQL